MRGAAPVGESLVGPWLPCRRIGAGPADEIGDLRCLDEPRGRQQGRRRKSQESLIALSSWPRIS